MTGLSLRGMQTGVPVLETSVSGVVAPEAVTGVTVDANADGSTADSRTPTITWTRSADDPEDGTVTYTVTLELDGTPIALTDAEDLNAATYQIAPALALSDDPYTVTVTPKRGNKTGTADSETFYVTPASIEGLALWLDASDASTLFQDSAGTTPAVSDGDPIGRWADKSSSAKHATQSTSGARPALRTSLIAGVSLLRCDGTDDQLAHDLVSLSAYTLLFVAVIRGNGHLFANSDTNRLYVSNSNRITRVATNLLSENNVNNPFTVTENTLGLFEIRNNVKSEAWENGTKEIDNCSPQTGEFRLLAGKDFATSVPTGAVDWGEIVLYDSALSDANQQAVRAYLMNKYPIASP